jgi:lipopolysaccharide export LptBFGC system permease protein LptF
VLATYALLSRRSEALAWWASGQSSYRLALPGVFFAFLVGGGVWLVQERIMPVANQKQDSLRAQIRNGVAKTTTPVGRQWLASADGKRIYNFEYDERREQLIAPIVYEFDQQSVHLLRVVQGESARWEADSDILKVTHPIVFDLKTKREKAAIEPPLLDLLIHGVEQPSVFKPTLNKPSQLSSLQLSAYIQLLKTRGGASADLMVALAKKHSDPYSPVVMSLLGIPLALAFGRKSAIAALASAILIGLVFWGVAGGFQQLGAYGLLPAEAAAWSPALIFSTLGIYLLSKART